MLPRCFATLCLLAASLLAPSPACGAGDHWFQIDSEHFTVLTDSNEKEARRLAVQFEQMRSVFHTLFPAADAGDGSPLVVLALRDRRGFEAVEPEAYLAKGQLNLAGYFLRGPDKNYILLRLDAEGEHPFATVYHEYTHLLTSKDQAWMPLWLNEGLAEFYQNTEIRDKDVLLGQPSAENIIYLRQQSLLPLPTLFAVDYNSPYYHEEFKGSVFYAESWALTHYLEITDRETNQHRVAEYARLLIQHESPVVAAQHAFGDLGQLQKQLAYYVQRGSFTEFRVKAAITIDPASLVVRAVSTTQADAVRAEVLVYNQRTNDAQALLDTTLAADPGNALAHEAMGFLKFRENDAAAAKKWYGEAVHLDSQSYLAHYYYAMMSLQSGDSSHDGEIESSLEASIKLKPNFAPAYDGLAMFYGARRRNLNRAHLLNLQAVQMEPENLSYRLNAAQVLMQQGEYAGAARVLKAARSVAKTPDQISALNQRMTMVEQFLASRSAAATSQLASGGGGTVTLNGRVISPNQTAALPPEHPTEEPDGPRHTVRGVLRSVQCAYPTVITLDVEQGGMKVALYRNDLFKIEFTATNFTPQGDINACSGIEGMKAKVEYAEVSDKSVGGQILSIELTK